MILVETPTGIVAWRKHDIATIMPEVRGRFRVVRCCGMVAHIPTAPPAEPWVPLANGWGNEHWLRWSEQGWEDPAGFRFPPQDLAKSPPPSPLPDIDGVPCSRDQIYAVDGVADGELLWKTDQGDFRTQHLNLEQARELMPELAPIREFEYINRLRIDRLKLAAGKIRVTLVSGQEYSFMVVTLRLAKALGITNYRFLQPRCKEFWRPYFVRDWPMDLMRTSGDKLRRLFPTSKMLTGNLIWQRFRYRSLGVVQEWTDSYQGLWYELKACLNRAGYLRPESTRASAVEEKLKMEMFAAMSYFVQEGRFFNFQQFGFREQHPERRRIGGKRPHILLVTEKEETAKFASRLAEEFDVSLLLLSGQPPLFAVEFFAAALREAGVTTLRILALVDYDPWGWIIARATGKQLMTQGISVSRVDFLVRGETFSAEETRLYAYPYPAGLKAGNRLWQAETGGVDGRPMGIHANHVQPYARVRKLFEACLEG